VRFKESLERVELESDLFFYPLQNDNIYKEFPFVNKQEASQHIHLILDCKTQSVLKGGEAIAHLSLLNPVVKKFSWLVSSEMGKKATSVFYGSINRYRETLRKQCPKCRVKPSY
jgi:hypothetical protein